MYIRMHERLVVWQEAYAFCLWIYSITKNFPSDERFGLTDQIRRASSSVPINIAEGNSKRTPKDKRKFIDVAIASLEEVHVVLRLAKDLGYITDAQFQKGDKWVCLIGSMLTKLRASIR